LQVGSVHTPFWHWSRLQQSLDAVQLSPTTWQPMAPHFEATHDWEQHWPFDWQASLAGTQASSPQTPLVQLSEQHWAAFAQSWPLDEQLAPMEQTPLPQNPEQRALSSEQEVPFPEQPLGPQKPPLQIWSQQSAAAVHASPSTVQSSAPPVPLLAVVALLLDGLWPPVPAALLDEGLVPVPALLDEVLPPVEPGRGGACCRLVPLLHPPASASARVAPRSMALGPSAPREWDGA
jgi:hypothetical protein